MKGKYVLLSHKFNSKMISVIVPVYNVEKYLHQCVNSLLIQTYKDFEIILVDDGSTDSSGIICDDYAKNNFNIRVIHKKNQGLGLARNTGLQHASGEYVTFIDSDDYADKHLLEDLYNGIIETNVDVCIGGFKKVADSGQVLYEEKYDEQYFIHDNTTNKAFIKMLGSLPSKHDSIRMSVWNVLYKLSIIKDNNIQFPSERELISEDLIFDFYYYQYVKKCKLLNNSNYYYRANPTSLTMSYRKDRLERTIVFYKHLSKLMKKSNYSKESFLRFKKLIFIYIRMCIKQEKSRISNLNFFKSLSNIKLICSNKDLIQIVNSYPVEKLGFKQRIFIMCIKYKLTIILYFLT